MDRFVLEIGYDYRAKVIPPGKRNPVDTLLRGRIGLSVRRADSEDMPIALRVCEASDDEPYADTPAEREKAIRDHMQEMRFLDGRLYLPTDYQGSEADLASGDPARKPGTPFHDTQIYGKDPLTVVGRVVWHNREECEASLIAKCGDTLFCEGRFWTWSNTPVWELSPYAEVRTASITMLPPSHANNLVRADRLRNAMDALERRGVGRRSRGHEPEVRGRVDILIPEALSVDPEDDCLARGLKRLLNELGPRVCQWPRECVEEFLNFRDACGFKPEVEGSPLSIVEAADAAARLLERVPKEFAGKNVDFEETLALWRAAHTEMTPAARRQPGIGG